MEYFESELLPTVSPQPQLWLRYVDDVIVMWPEGEDFQEFFQNVNALAPSIKFTVEWEEEDSLPFLDTRIHRLSSGFSFSIFRKPTHSHQYIHWFSWHSLQVKRSALFSLLLRAYRICDSQYLQAEIDHLYKAFKRSGYPPHILDSVHSGVKRKVFNAAQPVVEDEDQRRPTIALPHSIYVNNFVTPMFKANNCRVVNKANNTIKSKIVHNRPPRNIAPNRRSGVYKIPCDNCNKSYYGQTGREFQTRLLEHKSAVRRGDNNNACFKHWFNEKHDIGWDRAEVIYPSDNHYDRLVLESTYILKHPNFNNMQSTLAIDNLSANILLRSTK